MSERSHWDEVALSDPAARPSAARAQGGTVEFCKLSRKFVDSESSVPEGAADVLYYTLSIGHHTGIIDCFDTVLEVPLGAYERIVAQVEDADARFKLEGVLRFGEIEVNKSHVPSLLPALRLALSSLDVFDAPGKTSIPLEPGDVDYLAEMIELLLKVRSEPHVYLMVRRNG